MTFCLPPEAHESLSLQKEMLQFRGHVAIRRSMPTAWTHLCFLHWTTLIKPKAGLWWPWPLISLLLLQGALWWPWPAAYPLLVLQGTPATFAGPVPLSVLTAVLLCPWPTLLTWWRWSGDMWQPQVWIFSALLELHSVLTAIKLPVLTSGFQDPSAESLPWTENLTGNACSPASCSVYVSIMHRGRDSTWRHHFLWQDNSMEDELFRNALFFFTFNPSLRATTIGGAWGYHSLQYYHS